MYVPRDEDTHRDIDRCLCVCIAWSVVRAREEVPQGRRRQQKEMKRRRRRKEAPSLTAFRLDTWIVRHSRVTSTPPDHTIQTSAHTHMHTCMHTYVHACIDTYVRTYKYTSEPTCTDAPLFYYTSLLMPCLRGYTSACTYIYPVSTRISTGLYVFLYTCVCASTPTCTQI